jgi:orotate phosphoribosyltransferase
LLSWYKNLRIFRFAQSLVTNNPKDSDTQIGAMREELIDMLCRKSFKFSEKPIFKLVSGRMSRFYVNCKPVTLCARGIFLAGHLLFEAVKDDKVTAVGGLTFGADPLAVATAFASELNAQPINAFSIRKTRKDHGMVRWIEGDIQAGARVAIIDDVATTGGSTIKAIERARTEGLEVAKAVIFVDRQEGGLDNIRRHVANVTCIITRDELIERWKVLKDSGFRSR